jgi:hypothetical protein
MKTLKQDKPEPKIAENISLPKWIMILKKALEEKAKHETIKPN